MARAIGEVFDFDGVKLRVERARDNSSCADCCFASLKSPCLHGLGMTDVGRCDPIFRNDKESVIFVRVEDDKDKED